MMPILTVIYALIINRCYFQLSLVMAIESINQIQNSVGVVHYLKPVLRVQTIKKL